MPPSATPDEPTPDEPTPDEPTPDEPAPARQALRRAVAAGGPLVLVVMGRAGTGKSTQARALAEALGCDVAGSDRTRKRLAGVPLHERPAAAAREALYTPAMTQQTYAALFDRAREAVRENRALVLDATFGKKRHRDALRAALREALAEAGGNDAGAPCFIELIASDAAVKARLAARENTAALSDARREDFALLAGRYEPPTAHEDAHRITAEADPQTTTTAILEHLRRRL